MRTKSNGRHGSRAHSVCYPNSRSNVLSFDQEEGRILEQSREDFYTRAIAFAPPKPLWGLQVRAQYR